MTELDLTPLENHPTFETIDIEDNRLERIDLSPLRSCPNLKIVNLKSNPIDNIRQNQLGFEVLMGQDSK